MDATAEKAFSNDQRPRSRLYIGLIILHLISTNHYFAAFVSETFSFGRTVEPIGDIVEYCSASIRIL